MTEKTIIVGIDLAGSPKRDTGICLMHNKKIVKYATLHEDKEIIAFVKESNPQIIGIDAPLSLPPGRKSLEDNNGIHLRECDRELTKRKIRFFPITLGPMRMLTLRGLYLKKRFKRMGFDSIEIYPGATQDIYGIPRKQYSMEGLLKGLEGLGIKGLNPEMTHDELDSVTGGFTAYLYLKGKAEILGSLKTGAIIIPKKPK
jgi:predicted nuclease with RNAse H fold